MASEKPAVAILMADYGHDPTETALPFQAFQNADFAVTFFTQDGKAPECDRKMLQGWTGAVLGAPKTAIAAYDAMVKTSEWQKPQAWTSEDADLTKFNLVFVPGGHEKSVRQLLDSSRAQQLMAAYWPLAKKPGKHAVGAVCHGVQFLAHTKNSDGKSILHDVKTTALVGLNMPFSSLPKLMESSVFWGTRLVLGDYYKTYGAGTPNVETIVQDVLDNPAEQWKGSTSMSEPFVVEDDNYHYISARFPGDVLALAERIVERVKTLQL